MADAFYRLKHSLRNFFYRLHIHSNQTLDKYFDKTYQNFLKPGYEADFDPKFDAVCGILACQTHLKRLRLKALIIWRQITLHVALLLNSTFIDDQKLFKEVSVFASTFSGEHAWKHILCKYNLNI